MKMRSYAFRRYQIVMVLLRDVGIRIDRAAAKSNVQCTSISVARLITDRFDVGRFDGFEINHASILRKRSASASRRPKSREETLSKEERRARGQSLRPMQSRMMLTAKPANVKRFCVIIMVRLGRHSPALATGERDKIALCDSLLDHLMSFPLLGVAYIPTLLRCADCIYMHRQPFPLTCRTVTLLTRFSGPRSV